ncbi:MAG: hypothetical protein IKT68_05040 [Clostridia bacterium]|nr:hypothetical protein [Clostridia bacterium]
MAKKKKIAFSVLSLILIMGLVGGVFAWFYLNESTYVDFGSDIVCEAGKSLEISADGGRTWNAMITQTGFSSETQDITGDGINLYRPTKMDDNNLPLSYEQAVVYNKQTKKGDYVELKLKFRSTSPMDVYLSGESYISPANPTKEGNIFGAFSRDFIAGATRVAFIENGVTKMIWAPNPNYQLTAGNDGMFSFNEFGQPEVYRYTDSNYQVQPYSEEDYANSRFVAGSTEADTAYAKKSARLFSIQPATDDYGYADLTLRIWFEGTDREASHALAGGQVKVKLKFTGIDKSEITADQQQKLDRVTCSNGNLSGLTEGMSSSVDGINWAIYPETPNLSGRSKVFVRYDETASHFASAVKTINIS